MLISEITNDQETICNEMSDISVPLADAVLFANVNYDIYYLSPPLCISRLIMCISLTFFFSTWVCIKYLPLVY